MTHALNLRTVPGRYGIARLGPNADVPSWINGPGFSSVIRAEDELTLVCLEDRIPAGIESEMGWMCLRTVGSFAFDAAGVVSALIAPLSANGIGVFVICTFDGEHLLISAQDVEKARHLLANAGHIWAEDA